MKFFVLLCGVFTFFGFGCFSSVVLDGGIPDVRPSVGSRTFSSAVVEENLAVTAARIRDPNLRQLFINCYANTLDTTVFLSERGGIPYSYVITGDIPAMWLRDSAAQVRPFISFVNVDVGLDRLVLGLINSHVESILRDPYANAFYDVLDRKSPWSRDRTVMLPGVHERKWEIDSLCYSVMLMYEYWQASQNSSIFTERWKSAMDLIVSTFREQQRKVDLGPYSFQRLGQGATETQPYGGFGRPVNPVGLICSAFRPSDDATHFLFLVPSNFFAVQALSRLAEMYRVAGFGAEGDDALGFAEEVRIALAKYAVVEHEVYGKIFAYEVDGFGNSNLMDDANVPSLLSLPYLGLIDREDPVYLNTRRFVLSSDNPFFYRSKWLKTGGMDYSTGVLSENVYLVEGIGSPHTRRGWIWPMSLIMQGLTTTDDTLGQMERDRVLSILVETTGNTGFMHESFDKDNPNRFSRPWFSWANTLFGELVSTYFTE